MTIDEPFEYLTFGGTFSRTFGLLIDRFDLFLGITGVVMVPYTILLLTLGILIASVVIREEEVPEFHMKHVPLIVMILLIQMVFYELATVIGQGGISQAVAMLYVGQRPDWWHCVRSAWSKKCALVGSSLLVYGALFLAFIPAYILFVVAVAIPNGLTITLACLAGLALVVFGVYGFIGTVMTSPAIMIEGFTSPIKAISRSWELATGSRCYLICTLLCLWLMSNLLSRLLHNMFISGDIMDVMFSIVGIVVSVLPMMLFFPLHGIMETVLYLNLRIGRESMNHQVLSGDLMNDASSISRFRNDDPGAEISAQSMDYRHVPLMDVEDGTPSESAIPMMAHQNMAI